MTTYGTTTATTTWSYDPQRGFMTRKQFPDGKGTDYTYTDAGRLATRTWGRSSVAHPKVTQYAYDNGGRMVATIYSDTTPDVIITYDALGRQITQSNGVATSTYSYNSGNLAIDTETITYNLPGQAAFTRVIDRSQDALGRDNGWQLRDGANTIENQASYTYGGNDGCLASISGGGLHPPSQFTYTYTANSSLIANVSGPTHTVTNTWEANRDILASKENEVGTTNVSTYSYGVNLIGQRTNVAKSGTAFAGSREIAWGYDSLGQVTKADSTIPGLDRAYQFDQIGNRLKSADSLTLPTANNYTPNALNQYTAINALTPSYDDDGNMTGGPLPANLSANSTLTWDGENRLIQAQVSGGNTVTYAYDAQSRRISATVGSATTVYVYDGWNPIAEYGASYARTKTYTWGMDLSGTMQGAGGVGGLLSVSDGTGTHYPTYDGNGNVSEYLDSTGTVVAHYEYDPFGRITVATGSKAQDFSHRFSTKPLDATTGLYYYGYRYYDPVTGRWPSRDPIGEDGGDNLYGFLDNDSMNYSDYLGMKITVRKVEDYSVKPNPNTPAGLGVTVARISTVVTFGDGGTYIAALDQQVNVPDGLEISKVEASSNGSLFESTKIHELAHVEIWVRYNNMLASEINWLERKFCNPCYRLASDYGNAAVDLRTVQASIENGMFDVQDYTAKNLGKRNIARVTAERDTALAKLGNAVDTYNTAVKAFYTRCVTNGSKYVLEDEATIKSNFKKASWYKP